MAMQPQFAMFRLAFAVLGCGLDQSNWGVQLAISGAWVQGSTYLTTATAGLIGVVSDADAYSRDG